MRETIRPWARLGARVSKPPLACAGTASRGSRLAALLVACLILATAGLAGPVAAARLPAAIGANSPDMFSTADTIPCTEGGSALKLSPGWGSTLSVTVPSSGIYRVYARVASTTGGQLRMGGDSALMAVPNTASLGTYVTVSDYMQLDAGDQAIEIEPTAGIMALSRVDFAYTLSAGIPAAGFSEVRAGARVVRDGTAGEQALIMPKGAVARYPVDVPTTGRYTMALIGMGGGELEVKEDAVRLAVAPVAPVAGPGSSTEVELTAGRHVVSVVSRGGTPVLRSLGFSIPPLPLHVNGAAVVNARGDTVRLLGVNVASLEWAPKGERVLRSCAYVLDQWHANVVRLPLSEASWLDDTDGYRDLVRQVVQLVAGRGKYINLDMHGFLMPSADTQRAWADIARTFANDPAVLFGLFNEPHDVSWQVWCHGGRVVPTEGEPYDSPGMQALVDTVRGAGAHNLVIVGGIDWAFDLRGARGPNAIKDPDSQLIYDVHPYPWKPQDRQTYITKPAAGAPVIAGELGCDPVTDPSWVPNYPGGALGYMTDLLAWLDARGYGLNAWCFHPGAGPILISDWTYRPAPYSGAYVKEFLYRHGASDVAAGAPLTIAGAQASVDLGCPAVIQRWVVTCPADSPLRAANLLTLQASSDGRRWADVDFASGGPTVSATTGAWDGAFVDRVVTQFRARFVRVVARGASAPGTWDSARIQLWD